MIALKSKPTKAALERLAECERRRAQAVAQGVPAKDSVMSGYRHPDVKGALLEETCEKCAYCEAKHRHVYFGDVEHIIPVAAEEAGRFAYDNLTIACALCNNNKRDYHSETAPLLNPYTDAVSEHLMGVGAFVWEVDDSDVGRRTKKLLDLNRQDLLERRQEAMEAAASAAREYLRETEEPLRAVLLEDLRAKVSVCAEYSLVVRAFLSSCYRSLSL